jgi:iron complex transport system permease protein
VAEHKYMSAWVLVPLLLVVSAAALVLGPFIGAGDLSPADLVSGTGGEIDLRIFWRIRVPRVLLAYLAGAGLAVGGMTFQSMFRNPLATPFTLGVAGGAAFGAAVALRLGLVVTIVGVSSVSVLAFLGALLSVAMVYGITRARRGASSATMLLAGVAVAFLFASIILFIQYMSDFAETFRIVRWLMGGLHVVGFRQVLDVAPFVVAACGIIFLLTNELNLMSTGEELAVSRGVDVLRTRRLLFFSVSLMVGGVVAVCGPIGFVGLMAPHICRLLIGPDHRILMPVSLLFGGLFLTFCDVLARTVIAPAEIPVGVITALLGGPFFLWLLLKKGSEL